MKKHILFLLCMISTTVVWSHNQPTEDEMKGFDDPHRIYLGFWTEHYIMDDDRWNEHNEVQLFSFNVRKYTQLIDRIHIGKMRNSYFDEGLVVAASWETNVVPGMSVEFGLLGTNSYREDVLTSAPRLGPFLIAPVVGGQIDPLRLVDNKKHGVALSWRLAPAAVNVGIEIPFRVGEL